MAKKKKESLEFEVDSEKSKEYVAPMGKYLRLSQLLFNEDSDDCPYLMNELKETSMFYKDAKAMAKELEIDWEKMTSEESNRIMLNLLSDAFMACKPDKEYKLNVKYTVTVEKQLQKAKKVEEANAQASE